MIEFLRLKDSNFKNDSLDEFKRYQKVTSIFIANGQELTLKDIVYIDDWPLELKREKAKDIVENINNLDGFVAFDGKKIVGFIIVDNNLLINKYVNVNLFHVDLDYRNKGIGKTLFKKLEELLKEKKLFNVFLSANSAKETICFYKKLGFKVVKEIIQYLADEEPYDIQMEYRICK